MIPSYAFCMTADLTPPAVTSHIPLLPVTPPFYLPSAGWVVTRASQVQAVLADHRYGVSAAVGGGPAGSIGWLRASVSRFANGPDHFVRRARVSAELAGLPPEALRADAEEQAHAVIDSAVGAGTIDVMARLARVVPMTVLAARLGIADASRAAEAVRTTAAGYFPGADVSTECAADASTSELVRMLDPGAEDTIVAKIAVMVQGCDATAGLIGSAVRYALPPEAGPRSDWPTEAIVAEAARYDPPLRVTRRVSLEDASLAACPVPAGTTVLLRVDSANRDPEIVTAPEKFDPGRADCHSLTFGYGLRPCPGQAHAVALAIGVVQAVRDRCATVIGHVDYEPASLRIPARLEASLK
jgi:cytochrome P450